MYGLGSFEIFFVSQSKISEERGASALLSDSCFSKFSHALVCQLERDEKVAPRKSMSILVVMFMSFWIYRQFSEDL